MLEKLRVSLSKHKSLVSAFAMSSVVLSTLAVSCFAAVGDPVTPPSFDVSTLMSGCVTKMVTEAFAMITAVMPMLVTVFAATIIIKFGIKFVKQMFSRAG